MYTCSLFTELILRLLATLLKRVDSTSTVPCRRGPACLCDFVKQAMVEGQWVGPEDPRGINKIQNQTMPGQFHCTDHGFRLSYPAQHLQCWKKTSVGRSKNSCQETAGRGLKSSAEFRITSGEIFAKMFLLKYAIYQPMFRGESESNKSIQY